MAHLTCRFFAETLGVSTAMQVLLPQATGGGQIGMGGARHKTAYPVLYLLHGYSDDESIWMRRTAIERHVAELGLVVVMPRVELSYYQNMASGMRFWDFIAEELPALCRQWFPVSTRREDTFAAGLSMGGYGAFRLGLAHPERYGAVASLSGALDLSDLTTRWDGEPERLRKMQAVWGEQFERFGPDSDPLELATRLAQSGAQAPRFYQWCGTEDFLYAQNLRFRDHARRVGLDLTYAEGPGDHAWEHWDREIQEVLRWLAIS
jgi:S-formylglutathione hydrolase FrmB